MTLLPMQLTPEDAVILNREVQQRIQRLEEQVSTYLRLAETLKLDCDELKTLPYQYVVEDVDEAEGLINDLAREWGYEDCSGPHTQGADSYSIFVYVNGVLHKATAEVEYNRHDYTYYYVDGVTTKVELAQADDPQLVRLSSIILLD